MRVWIKHTGEESRIEYEADEVVVDTPATVTTEWSQIVVSDPEKEPTDD
jgi:hypothetical protein